MKKAGTLSLNKKHGVWLKVLIGIIALVFFLLMLNFFSSGIRNTFFALSSPAQKTFWAAGESCSGFFNSVVNAGSLNQQNQNLQNENQKLQAQIASLQEIVNGNQAQSTVSQSCQNNGFQLMMSGVVGLDDQDILSINKGSGDGIKVGMPVINQQGALYGKVIKVYKSFSQVMLISNKNSVISVKVQQNQVGDSASATSNATSTSPPEIDGALKGSGKLGVFLDLVPIDDTISSGDILVTSSLDTTFPKDLLVGTITGVRKNDQDPHQQASVQPFLSQQIDNVFVILNYKQQ